jgi:hypothetical protein
MPTEAKLPMKKTLLTLVAGLALAGCAATDLMSPEQESRYLSLENELADALADQDYAEAARIEEQLVAMEDEAAEPYTSTAQTVIQDFVPAGPWKPLALGAVALASRAFTRRGRRHLLSGAKSAARLSIPSTISSVAAALGYGSGSVEEAERSLEDMKDREAVRARGRHTAAVSEDLIREAIAVAVATALAEARKSGTVPGVEPGSPEDAAAGGGEMA